MPRRPPAPITRWERAESTVPALKTDSTDRTDPAEPIDSTDPVEPIDRIDPAEPIDKIDPTEPIDKMDPAEPMDSSERAESIDRGVLLTDSISALLQRYLTCTSAPGHQLALRDRKTQGGSRIGAVPQRGGEGCRRSGEGCRVPGGGFPGRGELPK